MSEEKPSRAVEFTHHDDHRQRQPAGFKLKRADVEPFHIDENVAEILSDALPPREELPLDKPALSRARAIALAITLTGASFLNTSGVQSAVIVLPTISKALDIPDARQQWVITAYALPIACFLLLWGRLADVYGRRAIFLLGSAIAAVFLLLCPFMPNEPAFDVARALHGLGAAANVPTAIGILGVSFPPGPSKMYAILCFSAGFPIGSVIGNIIGGVVGQYAGWHWVFWVQAFIGAAIVLAGWFLIPPDTPSLEGASTKSAVDWLGGFLITVGLLALLLGLTWGNEVGWGTWWIIILLVVGVLLVLMFVSYEHYLEASGRARPLMKVSVFRSVKFTAPQIIMFGFFAAFNTFLYYATLFYQDYQGLSVIQTTLRFIPTGVVGILASLLSSQILGRIPGVYILVFGSTCCALACLLFAVPIPPDTTYWAWSFFAMCLSVLGADTLYPCITLFTIQSLPQEDQAIGGGIVNTCGQAGRSVGLAIATALQIAVQRGQAQPESKAALLQGYRAANYLNFGWGIAGAFIAVATLRGAGIVGQRKK